jgi:hypothetical protein
MRRKAVGIALIMASVAAEAELLARAPITDYEDPGIDDFQAWYDTRLDITWLDDLQYSRTSDYDDDGRMTWVDAQAWIASLNAGSHLGISNWRLPHGLPVHEMLDLHENTLGNGTIFNTASACAQPPYPSCLANTGPFDNWETGDYWTDTLEFNGQWAQDFYFVTGFIGNGEINTSLKHAWAVSDGDLAVVPVPAAFWLLVSAVGMLIGVRQRR